MSNSYFKIDEDFKPIIKETLKDKKINKMNLITTGWTNIVYEVETNQGNYFFRFPRDEFWSRAIVKDYEFSKYIYKKTSFNTCKLELKYDNERPFSIHKKIQGTPLVEKISKLSCAEMQSISMDIAKFMYELHNIKFEKNDIFTTNNIGLKLKEFLNELLIKHVNENDIKFWKFPDTLNETECLVHGDLNSSNILLDDNNKVKAIIDFGFSGFGNKYDDISRILSRQCPSEFEEEIIKNYEYFSQNSIDKQELKEKVTEWQNIDNAYINYMRSIGIYE